VSPQGGGWGKKKKFVEKKRYQDMRVTTGESWVEHKRSTHEGKGGKGKKKRGTGQT